MFATIGNWLVERAEFLGLDKVAHATGRAAMRLSGVEFHPSREHLQRFRSLDELLGKATSIDAVVVIGRTLRESELRNMRHISRVIFPHPASTSTKHYAGTVDEAARIEKDIAEGTVVIKKKSGATVKWYPHMICQTLLIGDGATRSGWVHLETVLPFSTGNLRPSWTAYRSHHEDLVASMAAGFEKMWCASDPPDEEIIRRHVNNP